MAPVAQAPPRAAVAAAATTQPPSTAAVPNRPHPRLLPRQRLDGEPIPTDTIQSDYDALHSSPSPGAVAGITLGALAGFVLLLWLVYACINMGNPGAADGTSTVVTEGSGSVYTRRRRRSPPHHRHEHEHEHEHEHHLRRRERERERHRMTAAAAVEKETVEVHRRRSMAGGGGGPVVVDPDVVSSVGSPSEVDRVVIEERRRSVSRPRYARGPGPSPRVVELSGDEDEVVVIEEHSPSPRPSSGVRRQRSRVRSVERRSSGYREVVPERFSGGDATYVEVRRSTSRR